MKLRDTFLAAASSLALALPASASDYPPEKCDAAIARMDRQFKVQVPLRSMFVALNKWLACLSMGESHDSCEPVFDAAMEFGDRAARILKGREESPESDAAIRDFLDQ